MTLSKIKPNKVADALPIHPNFRLAGILFFISIITFIVNIYLKQEILTQVMCVILGGALFDSLKVTYYKDQINKIKTLV